MKVLLPLLLLLPTAALLIYARRARVIEQQERPHVVDVVVETEGGFKFDDDVVIRVEGVQGDRVIPADGMLVPFPATGKGTLRIRIERQDPRAAASRSAPLGAAHEIEIRAGSEPQRVVVGITLGECEAALAALRKAQ